MKYFCYLICSVLFLSACSGSVTANYQGYLQGRGIDPPQKTRIEHCHGYGCRFITAVALTDREWKQVAKIFRPKVTNAADERKRIAKAVGLLERIVGPKNGTQHDVRGTFRETGDRQLDCVDESTNTTTYLALLKSEGLLKFHDINGPTMRLPIVNAGRWPHQTAVITDKTTGIAYAVDSWFQDNGADADIVDLKTWKSGWKPETVRDFL
jgi:hypothetical protein